MDIAIQHRPAMRDAEPLIEMAYGFDGAGMFGALRNPRNVALI